MSIVSPKLKSLRKIREREIKKRKNFFPALISTILLWFVLVLIILFVDPDKKFALESFLSIFFFANMFTFSLIFWHTRRGVLAAIAATLFIFLRYLGVGSLLNLSLILGIVFAFEFYLTKRYK